MEIIKLDVFLKSMNISIDDILTVDYTILNNEDLPYEYITAYKEYIVEIPEEFMVFKRKSDGKHFSLWLNNGIPHEDILRETNNF